jgi:threonylcarbamoyladenosine tRNA methylthiotransferase MtaB
VAITTNLIVGFPGESEIEFEQTLDFVKRMQFARVHVFSYSARPGTLAAALPLPVPDSLKEHRARQMQQVADASASAFASQFIGRTMDVLWENPDGINRAGPAKEAWLTSSSIQHWLGYTDNYIRVVAPSDRDLHNVITSAHMKNLRGDAVVAETSSES